MLSQWIIPVCLSLSVASAAAARAQEAAQPDSYGQMHFIPIGQTNRGELWWYGHMIPPPYVVEIGYTLDVDTTWRCVYINRLPRLLFTQRPPKVPGTRQTILTRQVDSLLWAESNERRRQGQPPFTTMEAQAFKASAYEKALDLVDSARVITDRELGVYWHGTFPQFFLTETFPKSGVAAHAGMLFSAQLELETLQLNYLYLIKDGGSLSVPPRERAEYEARIDSLRRGLVSSPPLDYARWPRIGRPPEPLGPATELYRFEPDIQHPIPIDSLLMRAP